MTHSHRFSATGKTKYFGIELNGEFVKLQSKKASIALWDYLFFVDPNDSYIVTAKAVSVNGWIVSTITKQNSIKLFNLLQEDYNVKYELSEQNHRHYYDSFNSSEDDYYSETFVNTEVLPTFATPATVLTNLGSENSVSLEVSTPGLQYGGQQRMGNKRVLPTDSDSFYAWGAIDAITETATAFYRNEPGAVERVEQLAIDIDDAVSGNLIPEKQARLFRKLFGEEVGLCEAEERLRESEERLQQFRDSQRANAKLVESKPKRKQRAKASAKKHSHSAH